MTLVDQEQPESPPVPDDPSSDRPSTGICPYLAAADGTWRSTTVAREHRCGAVSPVALVAAEKQRRLCLTDEYIHCSTYEAARTARPWPRDRAPTLPRPLARTTPTVLDHGRITISMPAFRTDRVPGQAILVILLGLAFAAIILARLSGAGAPASVGAASASPSSGASAVASSAAPTSQPTQSPAPSVLPGPSAVGGSAAPGTPKPTSPASHTYKVKAGDTLVGIAARFGTTPKTIAKLNGISTTATLKVGQVLKLP